MFKKLKDKLAEEVKSSPQRIQQFAQAAQAAVTSASSSISDITNNDLFSIGDNESNQQGRQNKTPPSKSSLQSKALTSASPQQPGFEAGDLQDGGFLDNQRQRRLSNSSFTSDVSFKLPSYESPSMYHLQSDMDVSASEAEDRGFASPAGGPASLDRVTKEQLYSAYRRTQERYAKYRTQYADLAKHYKILERENAKARSVLVETQDKALRRISELREQCSLEQSAKAHLERALREEIDEKVMNIEALNTKVSLLQGKDKESSNQQETNTTQAVATVEQLIKISDDTDSNQNKADDTVTQSLNVKIEKMEQLIKKYKESVKNFKDKNAQQATEIETLSNELKSKVRENENLTTITSQLLEAQKEIGKLKDENEEIQNKLNTYDFQKSKEITTLEVDLHKAQDEIAELNSKLSIYIKKEEDYAISLAENKLSIHKELESKEEEIKALKNVVIEKEQEVQSLDIVVKDYKQQIASLEESRCNLNSKIDELNVFKTVVTQLETDLAEIKQRCHNLEQAKMLSDQENKCLLLQIKQEVAEKLAIVDRNTYLEERNKHLTEENAWKSEKIKSLENEIQEESKDDYDSLEEDNAAEWKEKCYRLETEMSEEREELIKLQSEIERMMENHNLIQSENKRLSKLLKDLQIENNELKQNVYDKMKLNLLRNQIVNVHSKIMEFKKFQANMLSEIKTLLVENNINRVDIETNILNIIRFLHHTSEITNVQQELSYILQQKQDSDSAFADVKQKLEYAVIEKEESSNQMRSLRNQIMNMEKNTLEVTNDHISKIDEVLNEKNKLLLELNDVKSKNQALHSDWQNLKTEQQTSQKEREKLNNDFDEIVKRHNEIEQQKCIIQQELDSLKCEYQEKISNLSSSENQNQNIIIAKNNEITELKNLADILRVDNNELKKDKTVLGDECKALQSDLKKVKQDLEQNLEIQSHLEQEKQNMSAIIKELNEDRETNLSLSGKNNPEAYLNDLTEEIELLKTKCEQIKQEKEALYEGLMKSEQKYSELESQQEELQTLRVKLKDSESEISLLKQGQVSYEQQCEREAFIKNEELQKEYDNIKQDNRRLQSDIEGLQSYLAKISKENSSLNDRLRDQIATSENTACDIPAEIKKLQESLMIEKAKVSDLSRDNSLLVEENFELKDQLSSHVQSNSRSNSAETGVTKQKHNDLSAQVSDLEKLNTSANDNIKDLQQTNHKLRISNEKLERRLDEALVSLRHLHSLQENTELEYLKNILYEYLTGSGEHSLTLAKVVSAVVKFDDSQTAAILKKEKERQGLLRQLGLL